MLGRRNPQKSLFDAQNLPHRVDKVWRHFGIYKRTGFSPEIWLPACWRLLASGPINTVYLEKGKSDVALEQRALC